MNVNALKSFLATIMALLLLFNDAYAIDKGSQSQENETLFLPISSDIPLMPGLKESDEDIDFDSKEGRVAFYEASGNVEKRSVIEFYQRSLKQLGWTLREQKNQNDLAFERDVEILRIRLSKAKDERLVVNFKLTSRN